jgi:very-short-patch-repair endonuclease
MRTKGAQGRVNGDVGPVVDAARRDRTIAQLATAQYGVVSRAQLLAAGISAGAIDTRLRAHRLHAIHRGVYVVGHTALVPLARELAAVLACGPGAALSHRSAAWLWQLLEAEDGPIDVTVPRSNRRRPGLRVHRSRVLGREDVRTVRRIPVTAPARTLLDLAEVARDRELERAVDESIVRGLTSRAALAAALERANGHRGKGKLRGLLARGEEPAFTRSQAEERFLALIRSAGLPAPQVNVQVAGHLVDFVWRDRCVVVEIDGYRFHSSRAAFERDRLRDAKLSASGVRVIRITWRQLSEEPFAVVARLAAVLVAPGA